MNTPLSVSHEDALDIVFADRNRAYGAYQLRRQYPTTLARALGFGLLVIGLMLALPQLLKAFSSLLPNDEKREEIYSMTEVKLSIPPPVKPPTPSTPPPVTRTTQRFVPPVVEDDKKVLDEPPKISNDDLIKDPSDVGKVNVAVPEDAPPTWDNPELVKVVESKQPADDDEVHESVGVQKPPSFPGGEAELMQYLAKNIRYPELAKEANIQGTVVLSFVIGKDGAINDVAILRELGGGCSKEAVRVVKTMPKWSPGESNGRAVKVRFVIPVRFTLK